jgi:hypothetical protein
MNVNEFIVKPTSKLSKTYKPNKMVLGKIFKKDTKKYEELILSGNITFPECDDTMYNVEVNVDMKQDFVGMKFNYNNNQGERKCAVVYLNSMTDSDNDIMAEVNNIRRKINATRKELGLKMHNKIEIIFEEDDFWSYIDINMLQNKISAKISFSKLHTNKIVL